MSSSSPNSPSIISSNPSSSSLVHNINPMVTRSKNGIFKLKAYTATKHPLPYSVDFVPTTYIQASKHAQWRLVMQDKFNAILFTRTWTLVPLSS